MQNIYLLDFTFWSPLLWILERHLAHLFVITFQKYSLASIYIVIIYKDGIEWKKESGNNKAQFKGLLIKKL